MNDITALMAAMKAAAEKAIEANERLCVMPPNEIFDVSLAHSKQLDADITLLNAHYNESTPANVKALVEALERAQQHEQQWKSLCEAAAVDLDDWREIDDKSRGLICKLADAVIAKSERISSLESRTITVKLPAEYLSSDGSVNADMANTCPVVSAYREAHRAAGIQVIEGEGQ